MIKLLGWFVAGAMAMLLIAANGGSFRLGDEPEITSAFTYHGQLKSGGDPYSGLADVRLTLWNDAFTGVQVGRTVDFEGVAVEDGLFAVEPDFGPDAFNGARRWIEVAVRAPAGSGGYLTLDPRQAVNATPYALYALNGRVGPGGPQGPPGDDRWALDVSSGDISYADGAVIVGAAGVDGRPAFEVRASGGGDDSVLLPNESIGPSELAYPPAAVGDVVNFSYGPSGTNTTAPLVLSAPGAGFLLILGNGGTYNGGTAYLDGKPIGSIVAGAGCSGGAYPSWTFAKRVPVEAGPHEIYFTINGCSNGSFTAVWFPWSL